MRWFLATILGLAAGLGATTVMAAIGRDLPPRNPGSAYQQPPQLPAVFYGTVSIDGTPAAAGTIVRAIIDGKDCTQDGEGVARIHSGSTVFLVTAMHETQAPGCGFAGKKVTFTIGGRAANEAGDWKTGHQELNVNTGSGQPAPLPTTFPTPGPSAAEQTAAATIAARITPLPAPSVLPTDDISPPKTTPSPSGTSPASADNGARAGGDDGGGNTWIGIAAGALVLVGIGVAAGVVLSKRAR